MKKFLALTLTVCLCLGLGVTALADGTDGPPSIPEGWTPADGARTAIPDGWTPADGARDDLPAEEVVTTTPQQYFATITVDGVELDTTGIPGVPAGKGYVPMRAITEAAGGFAEWYAEDGDAFFSIAEQSITVHLTDLSVMLNSEPVENVTAYLDPAGYTFLPVSFLNGLGDIVVDDNIELDVERYDITTIPERTEMETLAYAIMDAADTGKLMALDSETLADHYGFHMDLYDELVAYQPRMTAQPTTIVIAQVKEGQMDAAKADFAAYLEAIKSTLGFYPSTAEALEKAQTVESPNGQCLMLVCTWESNDTAIEMFNTAYPAAE